MAQTHMGAMATAAKLSGLSLPDFLAKQTAGLKRCIRCKEWIPLAAFGVDRSRYDGKASRCLMCNRVKVRVSTKGRISTFRGRTHTAEVKAKMSADRKGRPSKRRGARLSAEMRRKISEAVRAVALRGSACHGYVDGKGVERHNERFSAEYKRWRYDVYARDGFTCRHCGDSSGGNLHAHHVKPFAAHPALRLAIDNGITLCEDCHKDVHAAEASAK